MAKAVLQMKSYRVALTVTAADERRERGEGGLQALTELVLGAPKDSPLRRCCVENEHSPPDFPRLNVQKEHRSYTLQFFVPADANADETVEELYAVFAKNGWERW